LGVVAVLLMTVKVVFTGRRPRIFPSTVKVPPAATVTPFAIEKVASLLTKLQSSEATPRQDRLAGE